MATNGRQDHEQPEADPASIEIRTPGPSYTAEPSTTISGGGGTGVGEPGDVVTFGKLPDFEARLAKLEAELSESGRIIRRQASALAIGLEHAERLRKSRERVSKLEATADAAKKAASEAKKSYEAAMSDHFSLEKELDSGRARPPFPEEAVPPAQPVAEAVTDSPTDDESWRLVPIVDLEIAGSIMERLGESDIRTVGDLSDYLKPSPSGHCKRLTDLPGIGNAKAEEIEEALTLFWGHHHAAVAMDADPDLDVDATLQAGCEAAEARRAGEDDADD